MRIRPGRYAACHAVPRRSAPRLSHAGHLALRVGSTTPITGGAIGKGTAMTELLPGDLFVGKLVRLSALKPDAKDTLARWSLDAEYNPLLSFGAARPRSPESFAEMEQELTDNAWRQFPFVNPTYAACHIIG